MFATNFTISNDAAEELFNSIKPSCANTGTDKKPSFGSESSFLTIIPKASHPDSLILAIDVGGTRTKVCVRKTCSGVHSWESVLDIDNNESKVVSVEQVTSELRGLARMTIELGKRIASRCKSLSIPTDFDGVAVVWSNKLQCFPLSGEIKGVGGKVYDSKSGTAYRKGEWWNSDIQDGDNISDAFTNGLQSASIKFKCLVVGNDTIFTAKACNNSCAGVVASTGANTTIVPLNSSTLYNSECGGAIELSSDFLGLRHVQAKIPGSGFPIKIEDASAGKGLPLVYQLLVEEAIMQGAPELIPLRKALELKSLDAKELGALIVGNLNEALGSRVSVGLESPAAVAAEKLGKALITTAGKICGVLVLISIANQLDSKSEFLVALDSSQARYMRGYRESLDNFLDFWNTKHGKLVKYELLAPDGQISVPLRGAANSVLEFI